MAVIGKKSITNQVGKLKNNFRHCCYRRRVVCYRRSSSFRMIKLKTVNALVINLQKGNNAAVCQITALYENTMDKKIFDFSVFAVAFIIIGILFSACSNDNSNMFKYDNKVSINEIATATFDTEYTSTITLPFDTSFSRIITLDKLKEMGLASVLRYNEGRYYSVDKIDENHFLFVLYEIDDNNEIRLMLTDGFIVSKLIDREEFSEIDIGTNKNDVMKIDENTYDFEDEYTYHRFSDGSVIKIKYEQDSSGEFIAKEIMEADKTQSVIYYLLDKDLEAII